MKKYLLIIGLGILLSCKDDSSQVIIIEEGEKSPAILTFPNSEGSVQEGDNLSIVLVLDKSAPTTTDITIDINSSDATYGEDYTTTPPVVDNKIILQIDQGESTVNIDVSALEDSDADTESVTFTLSGTNNEAVLLGTQTQYSLEITDVETNLCSFSGVDTQYTSCFDVLHEDELNIVSWNIELFDAGKISAVKTLIENMHPDLIAVQEVDDVSAFTTLGSQLDGWEARVIDVSGRRDFGYLYKTCEITAFDTPVAVLDGPVEPRPAIRTTITHVNGLQVTLFNIHLKCCGTTGSSDFNRREASSIALRNHINTNLANENVIILGDWNDDIGDGPFDNFLSDPNFTFVDEAIGNGPSSQWSYPGWPSHLDHILISDELFDNLVSTKSLIIDDCSSSYLSSVSDHRPIMATFSN